jgi:hypothetical protein
LNSQAIATTHTFIEQGKNKKQKVKKKRNEIGLRATKFIYAKRNKDLF